MPTQIEFVRKINQGGQGSVWEGKIIESGGKVAIKRLEVDPNSASPGKDKARFLREMRYQAELKHENIVPVIATATDIDPPCYVMNWADHSLGDLMKKFPEGLDEGRAIEIFMGILSAIEFAHSEGVLHRDLKPGNVLFYSGIPKVSDFGLSRRLDSASSTITEGLVGLGTWVYCAPEQFVDAHASDKRADIYSLGKILYEMLTGKHPFALDMRLVPGAYRYVVQKCTENDPGSRYQSITELKREFSLPAINPDNLISATEKALSLLEGYRDGQSDNIGPLLALLAREGSDVHLYTEFVPYVPADILPLLESESPAAYLSVVKTFCDLMDGSHPFSYTDVIGNFLASVFENSESLEIQKISLARILSVGYQHNRFHLGFIFARLVKNSLGDGAKVLMIRDVLVADPSAANFMASYLTDLSLPEEIASAI